MRVPLIPPPDPRLLRRLYVKEQLGSGEIGERLGIPRSSVQWWLKTYKVPLRSRSEAAKIRQSRKPPEQMRQQLLEAQKKITPEGRQRQASAISGPREPWSDEVRAKHAYRQTPAYRQRLSEIQKGDKAHNWQGGTTPEEDRRMHGWEWRRRRAECYARDGWICLDCDRHCLSGAKSKQDPGRRIQAHHLRSRRDGGGDELENLVTLCVTCHQKREAKGRNLRKKEQQ